MTRTDCYQAVIHDALERRRLALDSDQAAVKLTITVFCSEGGNPRRVLIERTEDDELTKARVR